MDEETVVDVQQMLNETIFNENNYVNSLEVGKNERKQAIDALEKFYKLRIEESKAYDEFCNNQERRNLELQMHTEKLELEKIRLQLEVERLASEKEARQKEDEAREAQIKADNLRMWVEIGKAGAALGAWLLMSYKVMKFEETGSVRSKAFIGTIPKLKFW